MPVAGLDKMASTTDDSTTRTCPSPASIEVAPLNVPLHRRLQTAAVLFMFPMQFYCLGFAAWLALWSSTTRIVLGMYIVYAILTDGLSCGGLPGAPYAWPYRAFQRLFPWRQFAAYFPLKLIRAAPQGAFDDQPRCIFAFHPHGILPLGAWVSFSTAVTGVEELFPELRIRDATLKATFRLPFFREYALLHGLIDVSRRSLEWALNVGESVVIVVGGAAETLDAHPGKLHLTLLNRKGFVKLALRTGSALVPVLSLGETDLFEQAHNPRGSRLRQLQDFLQRKLGFATPFFWGRGVFNYSFGLLPRRRPVTTIVGSPIAVEQVQQPTQEQIDDLHARYIDALKALFNENHETYAPHIKEMKLF